MYLFELLKSMFRKANIGFIIYFLINTIFVVGILGSIAWTGNAVSNLVIGAVVYLLSIVIAVSPIGEVILRVTNGCRKITGYQYEQRISYIFSNAYTQAKTVCNWLPDDVQVYVKRGDMSINAFATGRKTICVTEGMMSLSDSEITAALAHEFGHLANHDTDLVLFILLGNIVVSILYVVAKITAVIFTVIFGMLSDEDNGCLMMLFAKYIEWTFTFPLWLWTKLMGLLIKWTSRQQEFDADEFAHNCGFGRELCYVLNALDSGNASSGGLSVFKILTSTHPKTEDRILRLRQMGARYP